jgi:O-acetyl-ADP-ribose deacetylase (regulator of RNase III)
MTRLTACQADITTLDVDAIVNAANPELVPGGGVCGAIHRAAGPALADACRAIGPCPAGEARITPGFNLPARHVIHAVGPRWRGGRRGEADLLASTYRSAIQLAVQHGLASIAFPALGTGIYGYPVDEAVRIAVATVRAATASPSALDQVIFVCFDEAMLDRYRAAGVPVRNL